MGAAAGAGVDDAAADDTVGGIATAGVDVGWRMAPAEGTDGRDAAGMTGRPRGGIMGMPGRAART